LRKTAETEKIKLRATLLNNCAVGSIVAGVILPLLALYPRLVKWDPSSKEDTLVIVLGRVLINRRRA
jgi:hypothetical protein